MLAQNYAKLLKSGDLDLEELDLPSDFDPADLDLSDLEGGAEDDDGGSSVDEAFTEYGIDEDELVDPSDDDDHDEMGELGSDEDGDEAIFDEGEDEEFAGISSDNDVEEEGEGETEEKQAAAPRPRTVRFADDEDEDEDAQPASAPAPAAPAAAAASTAGRYVPPHLRKAAAAAVAAPPDEPAAPSPSSASSPADAPPALAPIPDDPRLRRQLQGHLNKLSSANLGAIVDALQALYRANPRAVVSNTLTQLLLGTLADRDHLGEALVVTYAALCAALFRVVGIEFPAGIVTEAVRMLDGALDKHSAAAAGTAASPSAAAAEEGDFEGRPGGKEALNLASFVAELYNLQVVHCGLVYDLVRDLVGRGAAGEGMGELEVELLSRIVKRASSSSLALARSPSRCEERMLTMNPSSTRAGSGQQLRSDDPSALKDIVSLVKHKMAGVDPSSMKCVLLPPFSHSSSLSLDAPTDVLPVYSSRTRFMVEQLTNLKNNKFKATSSSAGASSGADGAVDHRTPVRKYLSSLNRSRASGAAPDPLRVGLGELRDPKRGKWWLVGAAWAGDPLAEHQAGLEQQGSLGGGGKGGKEAAGDAELARLARSQGMNTDVRKGVFNVLMSSEVRLTSSPSLLLVLEPALTA